MGVELPDLPATIKDVAIVDFLQKYYELSNKADDHEDFVALFTADGEYIMNGKTAKGHNGEESIFFYPKHCLLPHLHPFRPAQIFSYLYCEKIRRDQCSPPRHVRSYP